MGAGSNARFRRQGEGLVKLAKLYRSRDLQSVTARIRSIFFITVCRNLTIYQRPGGIGYYADNRRLLEP